MAAAGVLPTLPAWAADAMISTARTTPIATSTADGASPGNITVTSEGSVRVATGPAVTLDSSHTVTNNGAIEVTQEANAVGVQIATGGAGNTLTGSLADNGTISITGPAESSALWPTYVNNTGIQVSGAGIFNGSITRGAGSVLTVGGNGGTGIAVLSQMNGALTNGGVIRLGRQESFGIKTLSAISGDITNTGQIETTGQESIGIYAGGNVGGAIINRGTVLTGAPASTDSSGTAVAAVRGGQALWVAGNAGGIFLDGNALTKEQEEASGIPDGATPDSLLSVRGAAEAVLIGQGGTATPTNIVIGALAGDTNGASFVNRGNIATEATLRTTMARTINITGNTINGTAYQTTLTGAFRNEGGDITAQATDSPVEVIRIGENASVPLLYNSGRIYGRASDSNENATTGTAGGGGGNATGVVIAATGGLPELINDGRIGAEARGSVPNATTILDHSGTLSRVTNNGNLTAIRNGIGLATALDLRQNTSGITLNNAGTISGDMVFGSGADSVTSSAGIIVGNMTLGAGNDTVALSNTDTTSIINLGDGAHTVALTNSKLTGGILLGTGTASLDASASTLTINAASEVQVTDAVFRNGSTLNFNISASSETAGGIKAAGSVVVENGTLLNTTLSGAVVEQFTVNLIEAQSLTVNADLAGLQPGSTVMYRRQIRLADDNANVLQYQITRRNATELGLSERLGTIYDNWVPALAQDTSFAGTMAAFTDQAEFENALEQLVPDTSDAARRVALNGRTLSQGAINRRLSGFARNRNEPMGRLRASWWLQQLTTFGSGDGAGTVPGYSTLAIGLAGGVDAEWFEDSIIGLSISQTFGSAEEKGRAATDSVKLSTTSFDLYTRFNTDVAYIQGTLGYGLNSYRQNRQVEVGTSVQRRTGGKSPGYQWGGRVDVGTQMNAGGTILTAYLRSSYFNIYRHAYEEGGGGPAVDLRYNSRSYTSIRGGGGVMAERRIQLGAASSLAFNLHADYAHEFDDEATAVTARFTGGTSTFTLQGLTPAANVVTGGAGVAWERRASVISLEYDAEKADGYLGHTVALTWRARF